MTMPSPLLGEFLGTMIMILLGDGVVAAVLLKRSKAEGSGWMVITAGWAFAVMAGVFVALALVVGCGQREETPGGDVGYCCGTESQPPERLRRQADLLEDRRQDGKRRDADGDAEKEDERGVRRGRASESREQRECERDPEQKRRKNLNEQRRI